MSLATSTAHTEYEGDLMYQQYITLQDELVTQPPDYQSSSRSGSSISCEEPELQRTVAIIKPDALKYKDVILRAVKEAGLKIIQVSITDLDTSLFCHIHDKLEMWQFFCSIFCFPYQWKNNHRHTDGT